MSKKIDGNAVLKTLLDYYNSEEITEEHKSILNDFYNKYRGKKRIPNTAIQGVVNSLKTKEESKSDQMRVPIPKNVLSKNAQQMFPNSGDTLYLKYSELSNLQNVLNKKWNVNTGKFGLKNKRDLEDFNKKMKKFEDKTNLGTKDALSIAKKLLPEITAYKPELSDSLNNVIKLAEDPSKNQGMWKKLWSGIKKSYKESQKIQNQNIK
ncbi:MAG: hypothetical protein CMP21_08820 [Rickettsiales bacterium]|nr:hypothetical protein [Rickettsiales bacterium]